MKTNQITVILLGLLIIIAVIYDIAALFLFGADSTFSTILNVWAFKAHPLLVFGFGMVCGGLVVHFFGWAPKDEQIK